MTEQEIINYLKENKTKGVAFAFMPQEVKSWCFEHRRETIFLGYINAGEWELMQDIQCCRSNIYALGDSYEPKPAFEPHWEIFDIDEQHGWFTANTDSDHSPTPYYWWQWQIFLTAHDDKYNNFGGWYYDAVGLWHTNPQVLTSLGTMDGITDCTRDISKDKPAIPTKIAFWRYQE